MEHWLISVNEDGGSSVSERRIVLLSEEVNRTEQEMKVERK